MRWAILFISVLLMFISAVASFEIATLLFVCSQQHWCLVIGWNSVWIPVIGIAGWMRAVPPTLIPSHSPLFTWWWCATPLTSLCQADFRLVRMILIRYRCFVQNLICLKNQIKKYCDSHYSFIRLLTYTNSNEGFNLSTGHFSANVTQILTKSQIMIC